MGLVKLVLLATTISYVLGCSRRGFYCHGPDGSHRCCEGLVCKPSSIHHYFDFCYKPPGARQEAPQRETPERSSYQKYD